MRIEHEIEMGGCRPFQGDGLSIGAAGTSEALR